MYRFKIIPCDGPYKWVKADVPLILTPPDYTPQPGRPRKKRRKNAAELADGMTKGVHLSREGKSLTCRKCSQVGHNQRTCKGQRTQAGGSKSAKKKNGGATVGGGSQPAKKKNAGASVDGGSQSANKKNGGGSQPANKKNGGGSQPAKQKKTGGTSVGGGSKSAKSKPGKKNKGASGMPTMPASQTVSASGS
ncbi:hypothetical protein CTI12_AA372160 [Artemisia annua]|uniref:Zinc finger, SWIM-type n=1 Tax=Artemisia annua TaxID=35608 RepID=A0A2U1MJU8_ARTAN|nr:hypothetical protein CTI12_AA372160 [Artemisia annua]